jgi:hypothetical protein
LERVEDVVHVVHDKGDGNDDDDELEESIATMQVYDTAEWFTGRLY